MYETKALHNNDFRVEKKILSLSLVRALDKSSQSFSIVSALEPGYMAEEKEEISKKRIFNFKIVTLPSAFAGAITGYRSRYTVSVTLLEKEHFRAIQEARTQKMC